MGASMTSHDIMLNALVDALDDSAAGYAHVGEETDGFSFYAYCDYQAFERRRLASLLIAGLAASGSAGAPPRSDAGPADRTIVNLRIALTHGDEAVIRQLQRNDARLAHMLQASLVDGQLGGSVAQIVRLISGAVHDAQDELSALSRNASALETRQAA